MGSKLADLAREAEEATARVRAMTARTARQTQEVEALIAEGSRTLSRAATILANERQRTETGKHEKVNLAAATAIVSVSEADETSATDDG